VNDFLSYDGYDPLPLEVHRWAIIKATTPIADTQRISSSESIGGEVDAASATAVALDPAVISIAQEAYEKLKLEATEYRSVQGRKDGSKNNASASIPKDPMFEKYLCDLRELELKRARESLSVSSQVVDSNIAAVTDITVGDFPEADSGSTFVVQLPSSRRSAQEGGENPQREIASRLTELYPTVMFRFEQNPRDGVAEDVATTRDAALTTASSGMDDTNGVNGNGKDYRGTAVSAAARVSDPSVGGGRGGFDTVTRPLKGLSGGVGHGGSRGYYSGSPLDGTGAIHTRPLGAWTNHRGEGTNLESMHVELQEIVAREMNAVLDGALESATVSSSEETKGLEGLYHGTRVAQTGGGSMDSGRLGEKVAFLCLKRLFLEDLSSSRTDANVLWVNAESESGLPYDIVIQFPPVMSPGNDSDSRPSAEMLNSNDDRTLATEAGTCKLLFESIEKKCEVKTRVIYSDTSSGSDDDGLHTNNLQWFISPQEILFAFKEKENYFCMLILLIFEPKNPDTTNNGEASVRLRSHYIHVVGFNEGLAQTLFSKKSSLLLQLNPSHPSTHF